MSVHRGPCELPPENSILLTAAILTFLVGGPRLDDSQSENVNCSTTATLPPFCKPLFGKGLRRSVSPEQCATKSRPISAITVFASTAWCGFSPVPWWTLPDAIRRTVRGGRPCLSASDAEPPCRPAGPAAVGEALVADDAAGEAPLMDPHIKTCLPAGRSGRRSWRTPDT